MLQIRTTINGSLKYVDLYDDEDVSIEVSVNEVQDITKRNSTFTQNFKVPGSKNNNNIFDHYYDFSSSALDFDVRRKFDAELVDDGMLLFDGYIRLNSVTRVDDEIIYDVNFYSEVGNVVANIGDKYLAELDLDDLKHDYTDTIRQSLYLDPDIYGAGVYPYTDGDLYYGLLHRGYIYTGSTFDDTGVNYVETPILDWSFSGFSGITPITQIGYFDDVQTPLQYEYLTPMLQVKKMYEEIFLQAGYQINSDFFDTAYFKRYYFPLTVLASDNIYLSQSVQPCFRFSQSGDPVSYSAYNFTDVYTGIEPSWRLPVSDIVCDNISAATGSNYFTLEQNGYYFGRLTWTGRNQESPDTVNLDSYVKFKIRKQDVPISVDVRSGTTEYSTITYTVEPLDRIVNQSTTFIIDKTSILDNYALDVIVTGNGDFYLEEIDFHIYNGPRYVQGQMNPALELPEDNYKQLEFIQAVNQQFNLLVMPEVNNPKTFRVEPVIDWIGKGETFDWSSKVDRSSPITIQPLTDLVEGTLEFNYQDDAGWANETYKKDNNQIFSVNKVKLNQDYKDKITNFSSIIGSHIDKVSDSTPQVGYGTIPYFFVKKDRETEDGTPIPEFNPYRTTPKIMFRSALMTTDTFGENSASGVPYNHQYYVEDTSFQVWANNNRFITYPWGISGLSHYHQFKGYDTFDGQELIFTDSENIYDIYYKDYIEDLTDAENRLVKCKMYFEPHELSQIKWNEKIFVDGTIFRINKISNYSLMYKGLADVELIKLTREYEGHRKLYYQLDVCTGGTVYSNSDLVWSLYAYQGKYVNTEEYGRVGVYIIDEPTGVTYESVTLVGTGSSYGFKPQVYSACTGGYSFSMNVFDEYSGENPVTPPPPPSPTPTPSITPTNTPTPTITPTPSPTPPEELIYEVQNCDDPGDRRIISSFNFYAPGKVIKLFGAPGCWEVIGFTTGTPVDAQNGLDYTDCFSCPR